HIALYLDQGATILAADPVEGTGCYDSAEPNEWDLYQDFGHSHWHNSLIWGENLANISILGPGLIYGKGLTRWGPGPRRPTQPGDAPISLDGEPADAARPGGPPVPMGAHGRVQGGSGFAPAGMPDEPASMEGQGNKAIALKLCRNVVLRDFSVLQGGHFALLATGVDNLTIDNLKIDTNRDGLDIDCCRNVRIANCSVNSPNDDGICLKSSYALGSARAMENVTITNCQVSGYDLGTMLDGTFGRTQELAPDKDRVTGRIKCGTESNGGFKNITISNCVCERSRGLALETVDGGVIEDITITNIAMREVTTSPLFLRLGNRARGPENTPVGTIRRINISDIVVSDADPHYACIIAGLPGHPIEDVRLSNIHIVYQGSGTAADAALEPPERESTYPEPSMFGTIPAYGFFVRHAKNLEMHHVEVSYEKEERRPVVVLDDVAGADFQAVKARRSPGVPFFVLRRVRDFAVRHCPGLPDTHRAEADEELL
ncbi:MAG: glycosyl hydrolase family 28 protein, partial [Armatimonadota bacterium]|nr:glycosyl hydrolase family 28 protein [Armatimonadota bacterium]